LAIVPALISTNSNMSRMREPRTPTSSPWQSAPVLEGGGPPFPRLWDGRARRQKLFVSRQLPPKSCQAPNALKLSADAKAGPLSARRRGVAAMAGHDVVILAECSHLVTSRSFIHLPSSRRDWVSINCLRPAKPEESDPSPVHATNANQSLGGQYKSANSQQQSS
jgi:hypothetical protein